VIGSAFAVLARQREGPYLNTTGWRAAVTLYCRCLFTGTRMVQPISTRQELLSEPPPARKLASAIVLGAAGLGAALLLGALVLWFHYGTAVFFEMIASGIAACF
jgi:hypothetical protein